MPTKLHHLITAQLADRAESIALRHRDTAWSYAVLASEIEQLAAAWCDIGMKAGSRCAIYLPKLPQTVACSFAVSAADAIMVPINPVLKAEQLAHIVTDCGAEWLVTQRARLKALQAVLPSLPSLKHIVVIDGSDGLNVEGVELHDYMGLLRGRYNSLPLRAEPSDNEQLAAILYTSGSTGRPKGVMLTHRNMLLGAESVATYLQNSTEDRLLAVLPLSFDYGFSQLTTAFLVGAEVVLLEYLLPRDVLKAVEKYAITGLALVPPLWAQLAEMVWPPQQLRYFTNSGGHLSTTVLNKLREQMPKTTPYLMYGLTEAFRSTYLPPVMLDEKPGSMGLPIPGAKLWVVNEEGRECLPGEVGELVHAGELVAQGYWADAERSAERFRPLCGIQGVQANEGELAVWSGDKVYRDDDGLFYFVGRDDEMIKTSGYRVSPSELEETLQASDLLSEAVAFGVADELLGQKIVVAVATSHEEKVLQDYCRRQLPAYMQPAAWLLMQTLPRNANGKLDRSGIRSYYHSVQDVDRNG
ncbi:acyl-CoA ligase (AMP-forming) (exosortase A-associated) [Sinobacterium caligoides]|uniref:Acyl-CoA ligase (AMP-forming) (Exosortase A-associated) n=1 Tax=Sinobacterium caligoides TaxID=933926 RepID=A0A3N2DZG5_9GAMM|nr:acyl-CoA ligase (AMP-forming), exosortase A system-associated [Sinobacterium caligoides]ROS05042.1 acyl-CoA ligase (AMP-forming) (exosortase A-associated) [Sinobacterium caligoides]